MHSETTLSTAGTMIACAAAVVGLALSPFVGWLR